VHRQRRWRRKNGNGQRTKLRSRNKRKKQRYAEMEWNRKKVTRKRALDSASHCGDSLKPALTISDFRKS
jgi:hypothetical protein